MHRQLRQAGAASVTRATARVTLTLGVAGALIAGLQLTSSGVAGAKRPPTSPPTGFTQPYAGPAQYESLAPLELDNPGQLDQPIGQTAADKIAKAIGLTRTFTTRQYLEFITGGGKDGSQSAAQLSDESVAILTNTVGRPLVVDIDGQQTPTVLAGYGLFVNQDGMLESPAYATAPTRLINALLVPHGYLNTWCEENHAKAALLSLYRSAYTIEVPYGAAAQAIAGDAQLVPNDLGGVSTTVGMSMAPSIWLVNFALLYTLNPRLAADMPARWAPIPSAVVDALNDPVNAGQVPYGDYESYFQ